MYRMDFQDTATAFNLGMDACWLQFQCEHTSGNNGDYGFFIQDVLEALSHADKFYASCTRNNLTVEIYKGKHTKDNRLIYDTRKKGPHYRNHMRPLQKGHWVPSKWFLICKVVPTTEYATF